MTTSAPRHSVSVAATITSGDGRILVTQRRDNGRWEPPGGVLELDEDIQRGLHREVREETGLDIEIDRLTGIYKNMKLGVVALMFRCRPVGGELALNDEVRAFKWIQPAEVTALLAEVFAIRVIDALAASEVAVRAHNGQVFLDPVP